MKPTLVQLRSLNLMLQSRARPLTAMDFVKESWRKYLAILVFVATAVSVSLVNGWYLAAIFFGGYFVGAVERDIQWLRTQLQVLPLTAEITNWARVEQLVAEGKGAAT